MPTIGIPVIDAQVHAYERDHPGRPSAAVLTGPPSATAKEMVAAMDAVGVDAAILVSPFTMYRYDASYAITVHAAYPDRFALVKPVDPADPAVAGTIADWKAQDGAVAIRIMLSDAVSGDPDDPGILGVLDAAARHGFPVNFLCRGRLDQMAGLAARRPDTSLVVDHLGLEQPFRPPAPTAPWAELSRVLALAEYPNVSIKVSGACTLSHEPFPYRDIRAPVGRVIDAFGLDRCMWGTDWTRAVELLTYEQGVEAFRRSDWLSAGDRAALMGGTLRRIYGWSPEATRRVTATSTTRRRSPE
jgi:predicted TIM-barrel fold metal-dependent hydrolase